MILIFMFVLVCIAYTSWHFWRILPLSPLGKTALVTLYVLCFLVTFVHYGLMNRLPMGLAAATYEIGTSWMIFFVYALLLFLVLDLGRLVRLVPADFMKDSLTGTCTVVGIIVILLIYGGFHYHHKYREEIDISSDKVSSPITVVLASDLHVGWHNRKAELGRWVVLINAEHPDLVLFAGDILDGAVRPARVWHYEEEFRAIQAPVYASLGNHEYISGLEAALDFYQQAGIHLLRDSVATVQGLRIVGRDDRSNRSRKALSVLAPKDPAFTILLDHQPYHLEEAETCGMDFQFSGHTHHGQIWPGNWLTDRMYEKAFGRHQRGGTRYYVTSGLGIWGGKFRIGTRSEYIVLKIHP